MDIFTHIYLFNLFNYMHIFTTIVKKLVVSEVPWQNMF